MGRGGSPGCGCSRASAAARSLAPSGWCGSGAVVTETLGLVVLPACPFVVAVGHSAEEGSGAGPLVGDAVGPPAVLRGKLAFLGAAVGWIPEGNAPAVEPSGMQPLLKLGRGEILDQVADRLGRPEPVGIGREVCEHLADHDIADGGPARLGEAAAGLGHPGAEGV